jgi:phosphoglucosamine mutase
MSNLGLERHLARRWALNWCAPPVGDRYVLERMREHGYNVGGEQSGHIILSDYTTTGDGLVAALQVLAVVQKQGKPVSKSATASSRCRRCCATCAIAAASRSTTPRCKSAIAAATARLNGTAGWWSARPAPSR